MRVFPKAEKLVEWMGEHTDSLRELQLVGKSEAGMAAKKVLLKVEWMVSWSVE